MYAYWYTQHVTIKSILELAKRWQSEGKSWHFHILTPECLLNKTKKYVLLVENTTDNQSEQVFSNQPYMNIGQELVKLLHGNKVMSRNNNVEQNPLSETVRQLLIRANELSAKQLFWHHHMLFPECRYNSHKGQWVIVFEDPEQGTILESVSTEEPLVALQHIEHAFYHQKKH